MAEAAHLSVGLSADTQALEAGLAKAGSLVDGFGGALKTVGGLAFTGAIAGVAGLGAALGGSVAAASGFEKTMSAVGAVSGASADEMKKLSATALQIGKDTQFGAAEAAAGIEELVKAGVSIGDVLGGAAAATADLAAAAGTDLKTAAEIASGAMNNFHKTGADMADVVNTITGAVNASAIDINDFKFSLASVGAVANTIGVSLQDTATAIAVMGQAGIKGSDAGTSLKTMFLNLQPQTKAQIAAFQQLGLLTVDYAGATDRLTTLLHGYTGGQQAINKLQKDGTLSAEMLFKAAQKLNSQLANMSFQQWASEHNLVTNAFFDETGKVKDLTTAAGILHDATAGLTQQEKILAFQTAFGTDAVRAAAIMADRGAAGFADMAEQMRVQGDAARIARERLNNLSGSMEQLKGSIETAAISLGLAFTPALKAIVDGATGLVNNAMPAIEAFGRQAAAAVTGAQVAIAGFVKFLGSGTQDDLARFASGLAGIVPSDWVPSILRAVSELQGKIVPALQAAFGGDFAPIGAILRDKLAEQWARIDWAAVWAAAAGLANGLAAQLGTLGTQAQTGLRDAWGRIDWNAVWGGASGAAAGVAGALVNLATEAQSAIGAAWAQIDWTAIWSQAQGVGQGLADALGTALNGVDWSATGSAIGTGITGAISLALQAEDQVGQIATGLANALGQAVQRVDPVEAAHAIAPKAILFAAAFSNALFDPAVWLQVLQQNWQELVLAAIGIIALPEGIVARVAGALGKVPLAGAFLEWLVNGIRTAGRGLLSVVGGEIDILARLFGTSFADQLGARGLESVPAALRGVIDAALKAGSEFVQGFRDMAGSFMIEAGSAIARLGPEQVVGSVRTVFNGAVTLAREFIPIFKTIGEDAIGGLRDGVLGFKDIAASAVGEVINGLIAVARSLLGIASPSTVFAAMGEDTVQGMIDGLNAKAAELFTTASTLAGGIVSGFAAGLASLPGTVSSSMAAAFAAVEFDAGPFHLHGGAFSVDAPTMPAIQLPSVSSVVSGAGQALGNVGSAIGNAIGGQRGPAALAADFTHSKSQFGLGLSAEAAQAACGPYAALAFAAAVGRYPSAEEAVALARSVGWTPGLGMAGPASELALLGKLGISAVQQAATAGNINAAIAAGLPVAISTPNHYFVATGGTAAGGLDVGQTGTIFRGGGSTLTLDQIAALGGGLQSIIVLAGQMGPALQRTLAPIQALISGVPGGPGAPTGAPQPGPFNAADFRTAFGGALQPLTPDAIADLARALGSTPPTNPDAAPQMFAQALADKLQTPGGPFGAPLPGFGGTDLSTVLSGLAPTLDNVGQLFQQPTFQQPVLEAANFPQATVETLSVQNVEIPGMDLNNPTVGEASGGVSDLGSASSTAAGSLGGVGSEAEQARVTIAALRREIGGLNNDLDTLDDRVRRSVSELENFADALRDTTATKTGA